MRTRPLAIALSLVAALGIATLTAPAAHAAADDKATVFAQTNAQRTKAGLKPLITDPALNAAAQAWANHLARTCSFTHSTSSWRTSMTAKAGWRGTGENIAGGQTSGSAAVSAWMGSSGHKKNILNRSYTGLGVGYATTSCGYKHYWVQIFGTGKTAGAAGAGDLNDDSTSDVLALDAAGELRAYRTTGDGNWRGTVSVTRGWPSGAKLVTLGDFTGDGITDVGRIETNGAFTLLSGTGTAAFAAPKTIGNGWAIFNAIIGGIDFDGDGRTDVLARKSSGALVLYRGNGTGGWKSGSGITIGNGWNVFDSIWYAGDFSGDGHGDIMARRPNGSLWLYTTTAKGTWGAVRQIGNGWHVMDYLVGMADFNGDDKVDVLARRSNGSLWLYRGTGRGGWAAVSQIGTGWGEFEQLG